MTILTYVSIITNCQFIFTGSLEAELAQAPEKEAGMHGGGGGLTPCWLVSGTPMSLAKAPAQTWYQY